MEEKNLNLSRREEVLLGLLLFLGIFSLYFFCLFWPKFQEFQKNGQFIKEKELECSEMEFLYSSKQLKDVDKQWSKAKKQIPSSMKLPDLYMNLLNLQKNSGVSYNLIEFGSLEKASQQVYEDGAILSKVDINVTLVGTYEQVDSFLKDLYGNERRLEVTRVHYENREGKIHATIGLVAFALLKENDPEWTQYDFVQGKSYGKSNPFVEEKNQSIDDNSEISNNIDQP